MYVAGIDGGGSKTKAVVADESGRVLGKGYAGCGNHQMIGAAAAVDNMRRALDQALSQAGIGRELLAFIQYGLAGADRKLDMERLYPEIAKQVPAAQWDVVCDTLAGLRCGSPDNTGIVLVCGSNTNAAGRDREGRTVQVGGYNELYGDKAGGYYLSAQAFGRAIRSWDGREPDSILTEMIPHALGYRDMEEMINRTLDDEITEAPLSISIVVHEASAAGDWLSTELLADMGRELGLAATAVYRKLDAFGGDRVPIVLTGSILQSGRSPALLEALFDVAASSMPGCLLITPDLAPVFGSVMLAMDRLGIDVTESMIDKFAQSGGNRYE